MRFLTDRRHVVARAPRASLLPRPTNPSNLNGWRLEGLEPRLLLASLATDQGDYAFGQTALISGKGFAHGETVQLQVTHAPGSAGSNADAQNQPWVVQADKSGKINASWVVNDPDANGAKYVLTATGAGQP